MPKGLSKGPATDQAHLSLTQLPLFMVPQLV